MKKATFLLSMLFIGFMSNAQEVTVDEIIANYAENTGGMEAWMKLEGVKMSAEVEQQGMSIPVDVYRMKDGKTLTKISFQGMEIIQGAFDGNVGWSTNFMNMKAEKMDAEESENMKRDAVGFPDPILTSSQNGFKIEMLEDETIDGVDCFKLKLIKTPHLVEGEEKENASIYYFDKESFVPIRVDQEILSGQMAGEMSVTEFSDYQEVEGLYFPFAIMQRLESGEGQAIEFDSIELNPEVSDDFFDYKGE